MGNYYFFTEHTLLSSSQDKPFGPYTQSGSNYYRTCSLHTASSGSNPPAFMISRGTVLAQEVSGSSTLLNLIIKPETQPGQDFPYIDYIIYKGIRRDSLLDSSNNVLAGTTNALTKYIHDNAYTSDTPDSHALGLQYSTKTGAVPIADDDPLDYIFLNQTKAYQLPILNGGDQIGVFQDGTGNEFGIQILFKNPGFVPKCHYARELDSYIQEGVFSSPTPEESFRILHNKEIVLNFLDPCAFYGSYYQGGDLKIWDGSVFSTPTSTELYTDVLSKFNNQNKIYFDIRNEHYYSFNYYQNHSDHVLIGLNNVDTNTTIDYYSSGWPILVLNDADFNQTGFSPGVYNTYLFSISLPFNDNNGQFTPLIFVQRGIQYKNNKPMEGRNKFTEPTLSMGYSSPLQFAIGQHSGNIVSSYYPLNLLRRITRGSISPNDNQETGFYESTGSYFPESAIDVYPQNYLDNIFYPIDLRPNFTDLNNNVKIKINTYPGSVFVGNLYGSGESYIGAMSIAVEPETVSFFCLPQYLLLGNGMKSLLSVEPMIVKDFDFFADFIQTRFDLYKIYKTDLFIDDDATGVDDTTGWEMTGSSEDISVIYWSRYSSLPSSILDVRSPDNMLCIIIDRSTYDDLGSIASYMGFLTNYRIYLGIELSNDFDMNSKPFTKINLSLRGYKTDTTGNIYLDTESLNIECYTYGNF